MLVIKHKQRSIFLLIFALMLALFASAAFAAEKVKIDNVKSGEDVFDYVQRVKGEFDQTLYKRVVGAAAPFKEGDEKIGLAAADSNSRRNARQLLANTKIEDMHSTPLYEDRVQEYIWQTVDIAQYEKVKGWTLAELKTFLLNKSEYQIKSIMFGLNSDVIANVTKIMSNQELIKIGQKVFNPLPNSTIGAKGYLSGRIQPNSPTDNPEDIRWQVFSGFSYSVGDLVLGTNPVDSTVNNITRIEYALKDVRDTFNLDFFPHCVLSHIDVQHEAEEKHPGSTAIWFQSLAGTTSAMKTFDLTVDKMVEYAKQRTGKFGLYFETGQGADSTNGHGHGFDMAVHEARKYGIARGLQDQIAASSGNEAWLHLNDVAGFIGPECFKTREQLVRVCLEDIVMGKLHGICLGLDICSTLHMPVSLEDLDWCQEQIAPANPAYLMALPTENDPMLSYLTTAFQEHLYLREKFDYRINEKMINFFKEIRILDEKGNPTEHFGEPEWVYYQYRLRKGDTRPEQEILAEGREKIDKIQDRRVPIAQGYGDNIWDMNEDLRNKINGLYRDAKKSLWSEFDDQFVNTIPNSVVVHTKTEDREDYISNPKKGERFRDSAVPTLENLRSNWQGNYPDVQIVISDGLNPKAIMDEGHLLPYLNNLKENLSKAGYTVSENNIVVYGGRVRAGYHAGNILYGDIPDNKPKCIIHIVGERPGTGQHNFSAYITAPRAGKWDKLGEVDHELTKVISGISDTSIVPKVAAERTTELVNQMFEK